MVEQRYVHAAMLFLALAVASAIRMSFTLVLTQMVYVPNANENNETPVSNGELICPIKYPMITENATATAAPVIDSDKRYHWSQQLQGTILSSFFWGYLLFEIPGGIVVQQFGGKLVLLTTTVMSAIIMLLTPLFVYFGEEYGLIATRILIGFLQGPLHPCLSTIGISWFPISQRGKYCSIVFIGMAAGTFVSSLFAGFTIHQTGRWDIIFYCLGITALIWSTCFIFLCYDHPEKHPYISDKEKQFLKQRITECLDAERKNLPPTPWRSIIHSRPVITLLICSALYNWAFYVVNTDLPKYMNDVLHIPVAKNAVYSSIPRIGNIIISVFTGFLSDWMHEKRNISLTTVRKIFAGLSSVIPSIFAVAASYAGCDEVLVVILLTVSISAQGFNAAGTVLNLFDLAPNYIGPLSGVVNSVSTIAALLAPYIVGLLTPHAYLSEWRLVFWLTFILHISKTVIFTLWATAKVQPWNSPPKTIIS